ncbi:MAG TPA: GDSL-type esterase/lipase family protein [Vicinamibacterales bacterium]|jgi:lysophospholipase L1-like esterase|nr:GDSL-type esterase/lipase family protein [Vicinamibacterales bacterium]
MIRIVALGDSTTAGTPGFQSPLEAPPAGRGDVRSQYAWWLMRARPGWEVLNRGVNGERSDQIAARFERDVLSAAPDALIVIAGVNDIYQGRPAAVVIDQLRRMYDEALRRGIRLVAGTIVPYNTATPEQNGRMRQVNAWVREWSGRSAIAFADTRAAVAAPSDPDRLFESPDELHPSVDGYRRMADALLPAIERAISDLTGRTSTA